MDIRSSARHRFTFARTALALLCGLGLAACQNISSPATNIPEPTAQSDDHLHSRVSAMALEVATGFGAEWTGTGLQANPDGVADALWSPDGSKFFVAKNGNRNQYRSNGVRGAVGVGVYDATTGENLWQRDIAGELAKWSPEGQWLSVTVPQGSSYFDQTLLSVLDAQSGNTVFSEPPARRVTIGTNGVQYLKDAQVIDFGWDANTSKLWTTEVHVLNWELSGGQYVSTDTRCRLRRYNVSNTGLQLDSSLDVRVPGACVTSNFGRYSSFVPLDTGNALLVTTVPYVYYPYVAFQLVKLDLTTGQGTPLLTLGSGTYYDTFAEIRVVAPNRVLAPEVYNGGYGERTTTHLIDTANNVVLASSTLGYTNYVATDTIRGEVVTRSGNCANYYDFYGAFLRSYRFSLNAVCSANYGLQPRNLGWRSGVLAVATVGGVSLVTNPGLPTETSVSVQIDATWQNCITDDPNGVQWQPEFRLLFSPVQPDDVLLVANRLTSSKSGCPSAFGGFVRRINRSQGVTMRVPTPRQTPHPDNVYQSATQPNGTLIASAGRDGSVKLWNRSDGKLQNTLEGGGGAIYAVAWSPSGSSLASAGADGTILIWDIATRTVTQRLSGHTYTVRALAYSPDGLSLASSSWDRTARLWNVATGEQRFRWDHPDFVNALTFAPNGATLATAGSDGAVRLFNPSSGAALAVIQAGGDAAYALAYNADGSRLAVGGADKAIRLYDPVTGALARQIQAHYAPIRALLWLRDNLSLISSGLDNTLRVWDTSTGGELLTQTTSSPVFNLEPTSYNRVLTTQADGALNLYRVKFLSDPWLVAGTGSFTESNNPQINYTATIYRRNNDGYATVSARLSPAATAPVSMYILPVPRDAATAYGPILLPSLQSYNLVLSPGVSQSVTTPNFNFGGKIALDFSVNLPSLNGTRYCCVLETIPYTF